MPKLGGTTESFGLASNLVPASKTSFNPGENGLFPSYLIPGEPGILWNLWPGPWPFMSHWWPIGNHWGYYPFGSLDTALGKTPGAWGVPRVINGRSPQRKEKRALSLTTKRGQINQKPRGVTIHFQRSLWGPGASL